MVQIMDEETKLKVQDLMCSRRGLVRNACKAAGISVDTYYNIMAGRSNNIEAMNSIIVEAKKILRKNQIVKI